MTKETTLEDIENLVEECLKTNRPMFLANLIFVLQRDYAELAKLSTDGNYHSGWSHQRVLDYVTYEMW